MKRTVAFVSLAAALAVATLNATNLVVRKEDMLVPVGSLTAAK